MIRRFRGTLIAALALVAVLAAGVLVEQSRPGLPEQAVPDVLFRFEKDDLVGFSIDRPDLHLRVAQVDGVWRAEGHPWRPSRTMIRRVAHQLHDLDARADVAAGGALDAPERYGLGADAPRIEVSLADGRTFRFVVGDPNPTSVSFYVQRLPEGSVHVVKKAAMDFWLSPLEDFREDRITSFDADSAVRLEAVIDGERTVFERTGDRTYRMRAPVDQPASRDAVRTMLGRISALRATAFVRDAPGDLAGWGLEPPAHTLSVVLDTGERIDLGLGDPVPGTEGTDQPARYVYLAQDDAVYAVRDGMLDSFRKTPEELRDRTLVGGHEWELASFEVSRRPDSPEAQTVALHRTSDGWRWPDRAAVAGSTPRRVAGRAAELEAISFREPPPADAGLEPPADVVTLAFSDGRSARVSLGRRFEVEGPAVPLLSPPGQGPRRSEVEPAPAAPRRLTRQYARVDDGPVVEVDGALGEALDDLFREYARKLERDADKDLDAVPAPP